MKKQRRPATGRPATTNFTKDKPTEIELRIRELERIGCTCETYGHCWSCADLIKLRAELRGGV